MSDSERKAIDLGDLLPVSDAASKRVSDQEAEGIVGGWGAPKPSKPRAYIPAPPAPQVPVPYPNGM